MYKLTCNIKTITVNKYMYNQSLATSVPRTTNTVFKLIKLLV